MKTIADIIERAEATSNVQLSLADPANPMPWVWPEKPAAQWEVDIDNLNALVQSQCEANVAWQASGGQLDAGLQGLADNSRDIARLARTKYRNDPANLRLWRRVRLRRNSRVAIYRSGAAVREAWAESDATWVPQTGLTLAAYDARLATCHACSQTHKGNEMAVSKASGKLRVAAERLDDECIAWYSDATTLFPANTAEGVFIRTTIPTTTVRAAPVGQAVISNLMAEGKTIHFDCDAPRATRFTYLHLAPGAPDYEVIAENTPDRSVTLENQIPGLHWLKTVASNASGSGPVSAPMSVEIAFPEGAAPRARSSARQAASETPRGSVPSDFADGNGASKVGA